MNRIEDYQAFTTIIEKRSLTAAARHLGRSLQSVSRSLAALEHEVGVELMSGARHAARIPPMRGLRSIAGSARRWPRSKPRNSRPRTAGPKPPACFASQARQVSRHFISFRRYRNFLQPIPESEVELELSDRFIDIIGEGYDLAIRIGELPDSALKARRLANSRRVVFAAPGYLAKHGRPRSPEDLARHHASSAPLAVLAMPGRLR